MDDRPDLMFVEHIAEERIRDGRIAANRVSIPGRRTNILIDKMNEAALAEVAEKSFGIAPVGRDAAGVVDIQSMEGRGRKCRSAAGKQVSRIKIGGCRHR